MSDVTLTLDAPLERFVAEQVRSGAYPDAAAVVRAALDRLRAEADDEAAETRFCTLCQEGLDELDRGEGIEVTDVGAWLRSLGRDPHA